MTQKICNRCGRTYSRTHGGALSLTGLEPALDANLCPQCYDHMISSYKEEVEE